MKEDPIALRCAGIDIDVNLMRILGIEEEVISILDHELKQLVVNYCPCCLSMRTRLNGVRENKKLKGPYAYQQKFICMDCGKSFSSITYDEECITKGNDLYYSCRLMVPKSKLTYEQWTGYLQFILVEHYQRMHGIGRVDNLAERLRVELKVSVQTIYNCKKKLLDALSAFCYAFAAKKNKITFDSECWAEIVDYYNVACDERKKDYLIMSILWILILALKNRKRQIMMRIAS